MIVIICRTFFALPLDEKATVEVFLVYINRTCEWGDLETIATAYVAAKDCNTLCCFALHCINLQWIAFHHLSLGCVALACIGLN